VSGLAVQDFELFEDDVKQRIEHFSQDKLPLSVVLLLDISPSVSPVMEEIRKGALQALQQLKPEDEVALMVFAGITDLIQDFTRDRQLILDKIGVALARDGHGTRIHEAIGAAARQFKSAAVPTSRRVIIVITDNQGSMNRESDAVPEAEVRDAVVESRATVCGVIARSFLNVLDGIVFQHPAVQERFKRTSVNPFVELTGGEMAPASKETVNARLGEMIERLRSRYTLAYAPTNTDFNGKFRRIRLALTPDAQKRLSGATVVNTRQGYFAIDRELEPVVAEASPPSPIPKSADGVTPESQSPAKEASTTAPTAPNSTSEPGEPAAPKPSTSRPEEPDPLDQVRTPYSHLVMLDVLALNKKTGESIKGLSRETFEIQDKGVRPPISYFSRGEMPISVILLVDLGGNTGYAMSSLRRTVRLWTRGLGPEDEIALMAFAGRAVLVQDFSKDRKAIAGRMRNFAEEARKQDIGSGQNRLSAVFEAAERMEQSGNPLARRVIVVITDDTSLKGFESGKPDLIAERVLGTGCSVYALVAAGSGQSGKRKVTRAVVESAIFSFGNPISFAIGLATRLAGQMAIDAVMKDRNFGRLVVKSGGTAAPADGEETAEKLALLIEHVRNRYVIGFAPQPYVSGDRFRQVKLKLTPNARPKGSDVGIVTAEGYFSRRNYPAAPPPSPTAKK
ncbi:MAG TPA: VWA domain-containing protein, partial [Blastocatellia bacterium]|nr:VWA domain-containing protein [Blastocatellia bacterium]